jgi:hypothetical protein
MFFLTAIFATAAHSNDVADSLVQQSDSIETNAITIAIFNTETFFVAENALSINKKIVNTNNIQSSANIVVFNNQNLQPTQLNANLLVVNNNLKINKQKHYIPKQTKKDVATTKVFFNSKHESIPLNENLFSCNKNIVYVVPSKPSLFFLAIIQPFKNCFYSIVNIIPQKNTLAHFKTPHYSCCINNTFKTRPPPLA